MARKFFTPGPDLADRGGYYLLVGIIGFILVFFDQRTQLLVGFRQILSESTSTLFIASAQTRSEIRSHYLSLKDQMVLVERIDELEKTNTGLRTRLLDWQALYNDNTQLRVQLELEERQQTSLLLAEVSSALYNIAEQSFIVSRGSRDGAFVGQAVISEKGLIGQISDVFHTSSKVLVITDTRHSLPALLTSSQNRMIADGSGGDGQLIVSNFGNDKLVSLGEEVVTSGLGGVFRHGYPVGEVVDIATDNSSGLRQIRVQPYVKFGTIKYVFLVFPEEVVEHFVDDSGQDISSNVHVPNDTLTVESEKE